MPVRYSIDKRLNLVTVTFRGKVTLAEQVCTMRAYASDPDYDAGQHGLMDMSDCTMDEHYFEEMRQLAWSLQKAYAGKGAMGARAVYAPGDVAYGLCRILQSLMEAQGKEILVARTCREALEFLPLDRSLPEYSRLKAGFCGELLPG